MGEVFNRGNLLCKSLITGPTHVLLGIEFAAAPADEVVIEQLLVNEGECSPAEIDQGRMLTAVEEGVALVGMANGSHLRVARVAYVPTDTPSYELYRQLAEKIAEHQLKLLSSS